MNQINPNDIFILPLAAFLGWLTWCIIGNWKKPIDGVLKMSDCGMGYIWGVTCAVVGYHVELENYYNLFTVLMAWIPAAAMTAIHMFAANSVSGQDNRFRIAIIGFVLAMAFAFVLTACLFGFKTFMC